MKVIRPITITEAMLISSTVAEPDTGENAWSGATTYALSDEVYLASTHRRYRSKQAGNLNHNPATDDGTWWLNIGGTNKWAMFDEYVGTATPDTDTLEVTIAPGVCDGLFLYGMVGETATVVMTDGAGGPTVYERELNLLLPKINDWFAYYFEPYRQVPAFVFTDLPPYLNGRITLTVEGDGAVACGMMLPGRTYNIGSTLTRPRVGIKDYSRKTIDSETGFVTLEQRKFAKTLKADVRLAADVWNEVHDVLESLRATPCVWVGDNEGGEGIQPLTVFGFYRDMFLTVDLATAGIYSLDVEGMI